MFQLISIHKELIYSDEKEHVIYGEATLGRKREAVLFAYVKHQEVLTKIYRQCKEERIKILRNDNYNQ